MTSYEFFDCLEDVHLYGEYSFNDVVNVFIEEFKNRRPNGRKVILRDEPMRLRGTKQERAFYAALCEFYANWYHLPLPLWLEKEEYVLDEPWFPNGEVIKEKSPIEFRKRNIFIGPSDVVIC